eukprot:TRINITY_DN79042_c0_g1_i1.p1 TRINITY_DN79042_c0_g1~~TRINITY_DN79042_c0_g1_i1.p1  ORF type:complete len:100 (+),score=25.49 TRINITY_DN79042_c0_g1_i1:47-346(+)
MDSYSQGGEGGGSSREQQEAAAMAQFQQLLESQKTITRLTSKCFQACVSSLSSTLPSQQQVCLWRCAQRYMETQHFVQKYSEDKIRSGAWDIAANSQGM